MVYSIKKVHEISCCSSSTAYQEKSTGWILIIFTSNDKNPLYLPLICTLHFFKESKWWRSNPISRKTIWHIPIIKNSEFKLKQVRFFQTPFYFAFIFWDNTSHKFWDQFPCPHFQFCLRVSDTVSWHSFFSFLCEIL